MKEYRLKKWYPSLNSDWKHVENIVVVEDEYNYHLHPSIDENLRLIVGLEKGDVENNPEFWEEMKPVEKDYEILKLKAGDDLFAKYRNFGGRERWMRKDAPSSEGYYDNLQVGSKYATKPLEIYSVKRLSDGEVFTIGDKVINMIGRVMTIISLYLNKEGKVALKTDWTSSFTLNKIRKAPKPLFETEDGVQVFEGDRIWGILPDTWEAFSTSQVHKAARETWINPKFSTKKAAEDYIHYNKPTLSLKDIYEALEGYESYGIEMIDRFSSGLYHKLKMKVSQKLKK